MLFDLQPKTSRRDLYDFDRELEELIKSIELNPLTVVVGIRRSGKTSLLRVALNECGYPYIYIDPRFYSAPTYRDFAYILRNSVEDFLRRYGGVYRRIVEILKNVKGISIDLPTLSVEVSWRRGERMEIGELLIALDNLAKDIKKPIVIAIDEAQELSKITWMPITRLFAYAYDNLRNLRIVLTGSEIGVLFKFLGIEDPSSPLYGRYIHVIKTRRLSREESMDFLEKGFSELGINIPHNIIERAVDELDGIIGWLTLFGYTCYLNPGTCVENIDKILEQAIKIGREELEKFLSTSRSTRYKTLLKILTTERRWSEIKMLLETEESRTINDRTLYEHLKRLIDLSIVEKKNDSYIISDPILRKAAQLL
ncbi:MAG: ATP-binding protein [Ignisphaera sp.]